MKRLDIIKMFWDKFIYILNKRETKINKGKNLIQIKKNQELKLKILYSGFITWAYKAKIKKFQNIDSEFNNQSNYIKYNKTKYQSYRNRRIILNENYTKTKIIKYLVKQKSNNSKDMLRKFFYQWYINTLNSKYIISKNQYNKKIILIKIKLYIFILETVFIKQNKKYLKIFFQKIKNNINNNKNEELKNNFLNNIKSINEGYKLLENYIFRNTYKHPLYCIMDKINNENIDINLMKILMNKKRNEKELLKDIFLIWKNKVIIEKKNDIIRVLFIKIINIYQKCYKHNLLIKKLYQWKNISNSIRIKDKSLHKGKILFNIKDFIISTNIKINSKYFFSKIKSIKKRINAKDLQQLKKIILYNNRKNNIDIIRKYFNKWIHFFIKYEILILKGKIIFNIFYKYQNNNDKLLLFKYFNNWKNNIFEFKINENNNLMNNIFKNQEINFKESRNKIRNILLKSIFRKINKKYIYNNIKEYFRKWIIIKDNEIINFNKNSKLENIFSKIFCAKNERILKKSIFLWKNKINNLEKQKIILKNIFERNNQKLFLILNYYLNRWLFIANSLKIEENGNIIVNYCKLKIKNILAQKYWNNLSLKLYYKYNINNIISKLKYFKGFYKIAKIIKERIVAISFKKIIIINNITKFSKKISINIERIENKTKLLLLKKYLILWKNKKNKKLEIDNKLKNMLYTLQFHSIKDSVSNFNNIFITKKIININSKIEIIKERKNIDNEIIINKKEYLVNYLKRNYKFKILNNFCNFFDKLIKKNKYINMIKLFIFLKSNINIKNKEYSYKNIINQEKNAMQKTNLKFHFSKKLNNIKCNEINFKKNTYLILTSLLVKYINNIITNRKIYIFSIIKKISNSINFYTKYIFFINKEVKSRKQIFFQYLKNNKYNESKQVIFSNNLYLFMRKSIISKIVKILKYQGHFKIMTNLLTITLTHKNIAKSRYLLQIIKKWRFLAFIRVIFNKKMASIYNDLHNGYINLVNNIIEDSPLTKSEVDKMSRLDIKKYLNNYEDPFIIKNNELKNENKINYLFPKLKKLDEDQKEMEMENNIDYEANEFIFSNQKINEEESMEKDISFMESKFIKDNVNYLYTSYEGNSDIENQK